MIIINFIKFSIVMNIFIMSTNEGQLLCAANHLQEITKTKSKYKAKIPI